MMIRRDIIPLSARSAQSGGPAFYEELIESIPRLRIRFAVPFLVKWMNIPARPRKRCGCATRSNLRSILREAFMKRTLVISTCTISAITFAQAQQGSRPPGAPKLTKTEIGKVVQTVRQQQDQNATILRARQSQSADGGRGPEE